MEFFEKEKVSLYLNDLELVDDFSSKLQCVQLYNHDQLGKVLVINNEIQHVENWMPFYHESITHIPIMFIPRVEKVLILGGGDLYAAAEILKYNTISKLVLCDYDKNVLALTRKYYAHAKKVFEDKRFNLFIGNAKNYINCCDEKFDLIIDDCFNLVSSFENEKIFFLLKNMLTEQGVCSSLVYRHIFDNQIMLKTYNRLIKKQKTVLSLVAVPEYPGILHFLTIWGNQKALSQNLEKSLNYEHNDGFNSKCHLFNSEFCRFYLYLPPYVNNLIRGK